MISIIVPHLDHEAALRRCLESLSCQERATESIELIVVDNGSRVPPAETCALFDAKLLVQPIPGPGPARNLGVAHAAGDYLAFIDADCVAAPNWVAAIEQCFRDNTDVEIIGGDVRIAREDPKRPTWLEAYESVFAYRMKEYIEEQGFTGTGNLAVRRRTYAAVGPFGGIDIAEDREWGQRAKRLGYHTHYCATMIAYHPARKNFSEIARKWQRHIAHDFTTARTKRWWWPRWMLRTAAVAVSPAFEIMRIGLSDRISGPRARVLAWFGVFLIRAYRSGVMCSVAFGGSSPSLAARWNRV
jgi:glycosyltransferase involved in cell wall biosynthesis